MSENRRVDLMLRTKDYAYDLDSHFQIENVILSSLKPIEHLTVSESPVDSVHADGSRFVRGILIALPISALFWGLILCAIKGIF